MRVHLKAHRFRQNESLPQMDIHISVTAEYKQENLAFSIAPTQEGLFLPSGWTMSCLSPVVVAIYQEAGWTGMNVTWGRETWPCVLHRGIPCLGIHNLLRLLLSSCIDGWYSTLYMSLTMWTRPPALWKWPGWPRIHTTILVKVDNILKLLSTAISNITRAVAY